MPMKVPKLGIPPHVNVYDETLGLADHGDEDAKQLIAAVQATFVHFKVPEAKQRITGNLIMRFAMWMQQMDDAGQKVTVGDDPGLNRITDMYEFYNRQFQ